MNQAVCYIGADEQLHHHFSDVLLSLLPEPPVHFINISEATNWFQGHPESHNSIVLYERQSTEKDVQSIQFLRSNFPQLYILLVTTDLTPKNRLQYIQAGVNDTVAPGTKKESFTRFFQFIQIFETRHQSEKQADAYRMTPFKLPAIKRAFDLIISFFALLFLSPLLLFVALAIRLESKGPIFYKSKRVGSNYHIFDFWKFRSMYIDADKRLKEMEQFNQYATGVPNLDQQVAIEDDLDSLSIDLSDPSILVDDEFIFNEEDFISQQREKTDNAFVKIEKDPRVTKVGQFIRKYSIDELPQLINILKGDMSIVGNRPLPLYEAELLTKDNSVERFIAPAGLTGLWQVQKRGDAGKLSAEERKQLDIYYAQHYSLWLDIKIIFRTFTAFIQKEDV
ncbi:MAG: sugar transferase [Paludibacter sp.]|nr:sugar transferase [Paludibacter sp.]